MLLARLASRGAAIHDNSASDAHTNDCDNLGTRPAVTAKRDPKGPREGRLKRLEDAIHSRAAAAEVAAEEAAAYGPLTAAVEAVETAADPSHELATTGADVDQRPPEPP